MVAQSLVVEAAGAAMFGEALVPSSVLAEAAPLLVRLMVVVGPGENMRIMVLQMVVPQVTLVVMVVLVRHAATGAGTAVVEQEQIVERLLVVLVVLEGHQRAAVVLEEVAKAVPMLQAVVEQEEKSESIHGR